MQVFNVDDFILIDARKRIVPVTEENISDAARIHSISWQESHRSFCGEDFIEKHTVEHQNKGYGTHLLNYVVARIQAQGLQPSFLYKYADFGENLQNAEL